MAKAKVTLDPSTTFTAGAGRATQTLDPQVRDDLTSALIQSGTAIPAIQAQFSAALGSEALVGQIREYVRDALRARERAGEAGGAGGAGGAGREAAPEMSEELQQELVQRVVRALRTSLGLASAQGPAATRTGLSSAADAAAAEQRLAALQVDRARLEECIALVRAEVEKVVLISS